MTDEDDRSFDGLEDARERRRIGGDAPQRVRWRDHAVTALLQPLHDPAPARRIRKRTVHQHDGWLRSLRIDAQLWILPSRYLPPQVRAFIELLVRDAR
jgi:hypothetical protein